MRKRVSTILVMLSLVLCVATMALWTRSYFVKDDILFPRPTGSYRTFALKTYPGTLDLAMIRMTVPVTDPPYWTRRDVDAYARATARKWDSEHLTCGVGYLLTAFGGQHPVLKRHYSGRWDEVFIAYWLLTLATAVGPGFWGWRRWKARHRYGAGLCQVCGYDLRASPERCPECGTAVGASSDTGTNAG